MLPSEALAASMLLGIHESCYKEESSSDKSTHDPDASRRDKTATEKYINELVTDPGPHDVLCGRGGGTNNHAGNVKFRLMVNGPNKLRYLAASKSDKPRVASDVVKLWRELDPPGRFLARRDTSRKGPGSVKDKANVWYDVGDKKAREKASQCLRERTPDVIPFVREIQRQQDVYIGQNMEQRASLQQRLASPEQQTSQYLPLAPTDIHSQIPPPMNQQLPSEAAVALAASNQNISSLLAAQASAMNPYATSHLAMPPSSLTGPSALSNANVNMLMYALGQQSASAATGNEYFGNLQHASIQTDLASSILDNDSGPVKKRRRKK
jgi:hypothetical protein